MLCIFQSRLIKSFKRMVKGLPSNRLQGLRAIVLTNTEGFNRKKRRKKTWSRQKKLSLTKCAGWYRPGIHGEQAEIEIIVDSIQNNYPTLMLRSRFLTDFIFSSVLFHEIGHHIHDTQEPEFINQEDAADKWQRKLNKKYFWKKYWYFLVLLVPISKVINRLRKRFNKIEKKS